VRALLTLPDRIERELPGFGAMTPPHSTPAALYAEPAATPLPAPTLTAPRPAAVRPVAAFKPYATPPAAAVPTALSLASVAAPLRDLGLTRAALSPAVAYVQQLPPAPALASYEEGPLGAWLEEMRKYCARYPGAQVPCVLPTPHPSERHLYQGIVRKLVAMGFQERDDVGRWLLLDKLMEGLRPVKLIRADERALADPALRPAEVSRILAWFSRVHGGTVPISDADVEDQRRALFHAFGSRAGKLARELVEQKAGSSYDATDAAEVLMAELVAPRSGDRLFNSLPGGPQDGAAAHHPAPAPAAAVVPRREEPQAEPSTDFAGTPYVAPAARGRDSRGGQQWRRSNQRGDTAAIHMLTDLVGGLVHELAAGRRDTAPPPLPSSASVYASHPAPGPYFGGDTRLDALRPGPGPGAPQRGFPGPLFGRPAGARADGSSAEARYGALAAAAAAERKPAAVSLDQAAADAERRMREAQAAAAAASAPAGAGGPPTASGAAGGRAL